ncbi:hypothetical protein D3C87_1833760 [compost metagenome]
MPVLPRQTAQGREAFALIQGVGLLEHLRTARIDNRPDSGLFKPGREIFKRQRGNQDHAVILTVQIVHRPGHGFCAPQGIEIGRDPLRHLKRCAIVRAKYQRFGLTARFFKVVNVLFQARFLQTFP